jgi:hypothetical protein
MQTISGTCGNCQFWKKVDLRGPVTIGEPAVGNCFALPPTPCAIFASNMRSVQGQVNIRPVMKENDGCGAFMPRQDLIEGAANDA